MKILILDFDIILHRINNDNLSDKEFNIYFDITRLLGIAISKESLFTLYTKYHNNYGKLREYLCMLGKKPDREKFESEFFRRYKQLYFNTDPSELKNVKNEFLEGFNSISESYITALIAIGNIEFIKMTIDYFGIAKFINTLKFGEYLDEYDSFLESILKENVIETHLPESVTLITTENIDAKKERILLDPKFTKYNIKIQTLESMEL